ncbi:MAG: hypothetical protein H6760_02235 [Candidatus Nomurabacteria bacterium]|nr:MAG: hypothetical protein H6760_02235 [Candidatus Nomurabacteria bacterium]
MRKLFAFGWYAMLANQFQVVVVTADVVMISLLTRDAVDVGIYSVMALSSEDFGYFQMPSCKLRFHISRNNLLIRINYNRASNGSAQNGHADAATLRLTFLLAPTLIPYSLEETTRVE